MIRTFRRAWRYLTAVLDGRLEDLLDPRVQVDQAIDEAKHRHSMLSEQVATVRASERELDIRIARKLEEADRLRSSAEQAVVLGQRHRHAGDVARAEAYDRTAHAFATQLAAAESSLADLRALLERARAASAVATRALDQNWHAVQRQINERVRLLTEIEAATLQERMADAMRQLAPAVSGSSDVPTLADVRERVDRRFAQATARGELAAETADVRMLDVQRAAIEIEGDRRLEEIRATLGIGTPVEEGGRP